MRRNVRRGGRARSATVCGIVGALALLVSPPLVEANVASSESFQLQSLSMPGAAQSELRDSSGARRASLVVVDQPAGLLAAEAPGPRILLGPWTITAVPEARAASAAAVVLATIAALARIRGRRGTQ